MTSSPELLSRQGHRLLQIGVALFLFSSFEGFAVPYLPVPNPGAGGSIILLASGGARGTIFRRR